MWELSGRVVLGADSAGVPDLEVSLHRITPGGGGVIESVRTDPAGGFRFGLPAVDSAEAASTVYLAATRYREILYFGRAIHLSADPRDDYLIEVFETRPVEAAPLGGRRTVVAAEGGRFEVLDFFALANDSKRTLVPVSKDASGWNLGLPPGAGRTAEGSVGFGTGDYRLEGDRVQLDLAVPPGGRTFQVSYRLDGPELRFPPSHGVTHELLLGPRVRLAAGAEWTVDEPVRFDGRTFRRLTAGPGATRPAVLRVDGDTTADPGRYAWWFAGAGVLFAAAAAISWLRLRSRGAAP